MAPFVNPKCSDKCVHHHHHLHKTSTRQSVNVVLKSIKGSTSFSTAPYGFEPNSGRTNQLSNYRSKCLAVNEIRETAKRVPSSPTAA